MHADIQETWNTFLALANDKAKATEKAAERSIMATNTADMSSDQKAYFQAKRRRVTTARAAAAEAAAQEEGEEEEEEEQEEA